MHQMSLANSECDNNDYHDYEATSEIISEWIWIWIWA